MTRQVSIATHDDLPEDEVRLIGEGPDQANDAAAPLDQVRKLGCFARTANGQVIGGAIGRTWGECCELQQLWVHPAQRHAGIASRLVRAFEDAAASRGCRTVYLFTFSFQAPGFYRSLGYVIEHRIQGYPEGIEQYTMARRVGEKASPPSA